MHGRSLKITDLLRTPTLPVWSISVFHRPVAGILLAPNASCRAVFGEWHDQRGACQTNVLGTACEEDFVALCVFPMHMNESVRGLEMHLPETSKGV